MKPKQELSFSEMLKKSIDKHNKKHEQELKYIQEIKARIKLNYKEQYESQDEPPLNDNQINIMDMIK